jgi:hypothetical protein
MVEVHGHRRHFLALDGRKLALLIAQLARAQPRMRQAQPPCMHPESEPGAGCRVGLFGLGLLQQFLRSLVRTLLHRGQGRQQQAREQRRPQRAQPPATLGAIRCWSGEPYEHHQQHGQHHPPAPAAREHAGRKAQHCSQAAKQAFVQAACLHNPDAAPQREQQRQIAELYGVGVTLGALEVLHQHLPASEQAGARRAHPAAPSQGAARRALRPHGRQRQQHQKIFAAAIQPQGIGHEPAIFHEVHGPHQPHGQNRQRPGPQRRIRGELTAQHCRPAPQAQHQQQDRANGIARRQPQRRRKHQKCGQVQNTLLHCSRRS